MKIIFVGGGTGGHFYPLIAVAEEIDRYAQENQLVQPSKYYFGPTKYDEKALYDADMKYRYCSAGKMRRTKDISSRIKNIFSIFSIALGVVKATVSLYIIYPDVVFSKGGYASFPVLLAARLLRIPVVIHESDAVFGRVNRWSASFASFIAISYPEVEKDLTEKQRGKTALIGVPLRRQIHNNPISEAYDLLKIEGDIPTIIVLGGSLGAHYINENILDALPVLLKKYQVVHITGKKNFDAVQKESKSFLRDMQNLNTYHPLPFLNAYYMRALYTVADIAVTRAGSGTLFEIAEWGIPSMIIPIGEEVSHDQKKNAYAYARSAGGVVIEEQNLAPNLLVAEIEKILSDEEVYKKKARQAREFAKPDAAAKVAQLLVDILKSHEE